MKLSTEQIKTIIIVILAVLGSYFLGRMLKSEKMIRLEAQVASQSVLINNTRNFLISSLNDNGSIRAFNRFGWEIPLREVQQKPDPEEKK
jgi:hypothetical protein